MPGHVLADARTTDTTRTDNKQVATQTQHAEGWDTPKPLGVWKILAISHSLTLRLRAEVEASQEGANPIVIAILTAHQKSKTEVNDLENELIEHSHTGCSIQRCLCRGETSA